MKVQNQIKRVLSEHSSIEIIRGLLSEDADAYRSVFADAVCQHFGFYDARGRVQRSGCIKVLRELEHSGHFVLPAASPGGPREPGVRAVLVSPSRTRKRCRDRPVKFARCV